MKEGWYRGYKVYIDLVNRHRDTPMADLVKLWKNSYPTEEQIKKYKEAMGKICMYCKKTIRIEDFMDGKASDRWQPDTAYAPEKTEYFHVACDNEAATDTLGKLK